MEMNNKKSGTVEKAFDQLKTCPLFAGISEADRAALLDCLGAKVRKMEKNEVLFALGDRPEHVGIVLAGSVHIVQEDYWGNRTILAAAQAGELFGEAFACAEAAVFPVSVIARSAGSVLLVDCRRILTTCSASCIFHARLIRNLMKIMATKNMFLTRKMEHITKKSTQERVRSYLSECALAEGKNSFAIPFNRQELADYLSVERSALSNTLCKMRDEGMIEFCKNRFTIL